MPLGAKFGVFPDKVPQLLKKARELDLNVVGVAFHVGSDCRESEVYERAIHACKKVS